MKQKHRQADTSATQHPGWSYNELCNQRRICEANIAHQEAHIARLAEHILSPRTITNVLTGITLKGLRNSISLIGIIGSSWRNIKKIGQLIKRFI
ncbi:MAG: hypothetical protein IJE18_03915 [Bacteroidaceae bacterium]|nr:hypothetical protein [Bacteroidaceae bacterium]